MSKLERTLKVTGQHRQKLYRSGGKKTRRKKHRKPKRARTLNDSIQDSEQGKVKEENTKTKLEVALKSAMEGIHTTGERTEDKLVGSPKIGCRKTFNMEKLRIDLEYDRRQKREERRHQFDRKMIMVAFEHRQEIPEYPTNQVGMGSNREAGPGHSGWGFREREDQTTKAVNRIRMNLHISGCNCKLCRIRIQNDP